jgi:hypothetical protein
VTQEIWIQNLVDGLDFMGDLDRQRRCWLEVAPPEWPSPEELLCQTFDDTDLERRLNSATGFSLDVDSMLRLMSKMAAEVDTDQDARQLLLDSGWVRLSQLARQVADLITHAPPHSPAAP